MNHLTKGCPPFTVEQKGKISAEYLIPKVLHDAKDKNTSAIKKKAGDPSVQNEKDPSGHKEKEVDLSVQKQNGDSSQKEKDPSAQKVKEDSSTQKEDEEQKKEEEKKENYLSELVLYIHNNELIKGIIDKAQFGKYGIVHTVHELYGADTAGILLSTFSRLFTLFLQVNLD